MAVDHEGFTLDFDSWYQHKRRDRENILLPSGLSPAANSLVNSYRRFKQEMDSRTAEFHLLEKLANNEVISPKPDLPNVSSGETSGIVRRMARNLVQNTPNVEVVSVFDDDGQKGIFARHILLSKIIGSDQYSNDMQQNLFASTKTSLTLGFACVIPCLLQDAAGSWYMKYDTIHYRDVFPEPGARDVRDATEVFVRRYMTRGELRSIVKNRIAGWDHDAVKALLRDFSVPPKRQIESTSNTDKRRGVISEGYEMITWYTSGGDSFLTFTPHGDYLLRIEKNKHPLKEHPVMFLVLEKDDQQPLGKSQVELLLGRQEFQDLMHNGAMKLWYRNINPTILGYGGPQATPNMSPGKYVQISNPNAKLEPFEVNTQTLMQYQMISQGNMGAMINLVGSADQQMATQAGYGMSATPQGVEAQQGLVDITTNNYQKAIEQFFSHYCSYALMIYFQELKSVKKVSLTAEARQQLLGAGLDASNITEDYELEIDFSDLAIEYFVRCVPGSLVEMEDEKQLRILNQLFVPLSQAMPALAATGDQAMLKNFAVAMQFIVQRQIELSGSNRKEQISDTLKHGKLPEDRVGEFEDQLNALSMTLENMQTMALAMGSLQEQVKALTETQGIILQKVGAPTDGSSLQQPETGEDGVVPVV